MNQGPVPSLKSHHSKSLLPGVRSQVLHILETYLEELEGGLLIDPESLLKRYPELGEQLKPYLASLEFLHHAAGSIRTAEGSTGALHNIGEQAHRVLGEYQILREIGRGGMGVVYEAEQKSLGRKVALKVLPFYSLLDPMRIERFQREARAAASLQHPNIVPVYGAGEDVGVHYYAMQFIEGRGIDAVIRRVNSLFSKHSQPEEGANRDAQDDMSSCLALSLLCDPPNVTDGKNRIVTEKDSHGSDFPAKGVGDKGPSYYASVAKIGLQVASALSYAHSQGILHRDIKPSNILLDLRGTAWVADFGLAKAEGSKELTSSGGWVGTLPYMAPERFKGHSDALSDIYGLGMTLYELLTLKPAFAQTERETLVAAILEKEPPRPRELDCGVPQDLEAIALRSIAKDRDRRYRSAEELAEDLERFLDGRPIAEPRRGPPVPLSAMRRRTRHLALAILAVLALAALSTVAVFLASRDTRPPGLLEISVGEGPIASVAADLNGDRRLDLAVVNKVSGDVSVLLNEGGGRFHTQPPLKVGNAPLSLAAADFDGDGYIDLAAANKESRNISILVNEGRGLFAPAVNIDLEHKLFTLIAADLDGDARPDLAVAGGEKSVLILRNAGGATFQKAEAFETGAYPTFLAAGDLDRDGDLDLVTVNNNASEQVSVLLNAGNGTLGPRSGYEMGGYGRGLVIADLDGDGNLDLAGTRRDAQSVWILRGLGGGGFAPREPISLGGRVQAVISSDPRGDGRPDLIAVGGKGNVIFVRNNGDGSFEEPVNLDFGMNPNSVVAAELDGDRRLDLAVTSWGSNRLTVLFQRSADWTTR